MIAASMIYRWTKAVRSCTCRGVGCMEVCCSHPLLCRWLVSHPFGALCACWRSAGGFWYLRVIALWNAIVGIVGISLVFSSRKNNEMWLFTSFHVNQYRQKESQQRVFWQMWIDSVASKARKMTYCIYIYIHVCVFYLINNVLMHAHTHVYIYIYVCVCVSVSLSLSLCIYIYSVLYICTYVLVILLAASRCACRLKVMLVMASWWAMPWGCGEEEAPTSSSSCCSPAFAVPILLSHARCCKAPFVLRLVWTLHDLHKFTFAFLEPSRLAA